MGGGGGGGEMGGIGGIEGGGRRMRFGSRVPSQMATPMGTARTKTHGTQHHSEKQGQSRRSGGTTLRRPFSAFSYTKTLRVGLAAFVPALPVLTSEWNVNVSMQPPITTQPVRV